MCWPHVQGSILATRLILKSFTLATDVNFPFICKLHWAPGITVNWPGSGLSHISGLRSGKIMDPSPLCCGCWPTVPIFGSGNSSDLDGFTPYAVSSPSVSDADALPDPRVGQPEQGVGGGDPAKRSE